MSFPLVDVETKGNQLMCLLLFLGLCDFSHIIIVIILMNSDLHRLCRSAFSLEKASGTKPPLINMEADTHTHTQHFRPSLRH